MPHTKDKKDMKVEPGDQSKAPKHGKMERPQGETVCSPKELDGKQSMAPAHKGKKPAHGDNPAVDPKPFPMEEPSKERLDKKYKQVD